MKVDGETFYYHYNPRGDVIAMTDKDGNKAAEYDYDAWGNVLKSNIINPKVESNPFGYAGYMYDKEIEMYYLIARYYHPEHGVFLSVDPDPGDEDDPVTQNGYTYANNNPVMMVDPYGHWAWMAAGAIFGGVNSYYSARKRGAFVKKYNVCEIELENKVLNIYSQIHILCQREYEKHQSFFKDRGLELKIDLIEMIFKGKNIQQVKGANIFELGYESSIGIMILEESEPILEHYIPIWECKKKLFRNQGYLYMDNILDIEEELQQYLIGAIEEIEDEK